MELSKLKKWLPVLFASGILIPTQTQAENFPEANSTVLYGYNNTSGYNVNTSLPSGIYSFPAAGGNAALVADGNKFIIPQISCYSDGKYYMVEVISDWFTDTTSTYINIYDVRNWELINRVEVKGVVPQRDFCISPDGTKGYATAMNGDNFDTYLNEIDLATGESKKLFAIDGYYYIGSCFSPNGKLLMWNATQYQMQAIDLQSSTITDYAAGTVPDFDGTSSFYYSAHDNCIYAAGADGYTGNYKIVKINPSDGTHQTIGTVPEQMAVTGIYAPDYNDDVPEAVEDVDFTYTSAGSQQATLSFVMPSTTYSGGDLSGKLEAIITVDGISEEISSESGKKVVLEQNLTPGLHIICIEAKNAAGISPQRRLSTFTGLDAPSAVENLVFEIDDYGKAHLEWSAPGKSIHGGYIDMDNLTYTVVRNPGNIVVTSGSRATSFEEQLPDAFAHYSYTVTPYSGEMEGVSSNTEAYTWGENNVPPFVETFDYWEDFSRFTTINPNEDGFGWYSGYENAYCYAGNDQKSDYWLFTPAINLEAGKIYTTAFDMFASSNDNKFCELELSICDAPTLNSDKRVLIPTFSDNDNNAKTHVTEFSVDKSGLYYLAFHNTTDAGGAQTYVDNITVVPNSDITAAGKVENLTAVCGDKGALTATLSFIAPSENADGTALSSISKVEIHRYGQANPIATLTDAVPGQPMSWTDENASEGRNIYAVTAYSGNTKGMTAHVAVTAGLDAPQTVTSLKVSTSTSGNALLEWNAPGETGINGGYADISKISYNIYRADDIHGYYIPCIKYENNTLCFEDDTFQMPEDKTQNVVRYFVSAVNEKGESPKSEVTYTWGVPTETPLHESFANAAYGNDGWETVASTGMADWTLESGETTIVQPHDADRGMMRFFNNGVAEAKATLWSPRIAVSGKELELSFMMYHGNETEPGDLNLNIQAMADDAASVALASVEYADGSQGWKRHSVNLGTLSSADNIIIEFIGYAADGSASIFIDNIKVSEKLENDIELSGLDIPESIEHSGSFADVTVSNIGKSPANFNLVLYKDEIPVAEEAISDMAAGESRTFPMDMNILRTESAATITYRAEAIMDNDQNKDNNSSKSLSTFVKRNILPAIEIEGENNSNVITLTWDKPEAVMAAKSLDSFESYSPYALNNFGEWITVDKDGMPTDFSKYWKQLPNAKTPMAWEVWDIKQVGADGFFTEGLANEENFLPHSGDKALISFTAIEQSWFGDTPTKNDNWLISPEIIGGTDMSFWMKSLSTSNTEFIELYYTSENVNTSDPDISKFILLNTYSLYGKEWRKVTYTLPADATRFAVRQCTQNNGYIVMLDDFDFLPLSGSLNPIKPKGYNVYRNNEIIGTTDNEQYMDRPTQDGKYSYFVTTLWEEGESAASNIFATEAKDVNSLYNIDTDNDNVVITSGQGFIRISSLNTVNCTVYASDGTVLFQGDVNGDRLIDATSGVYIVSAAQYAKKVIVK